MTKPKICKKRAKVTKLPDRYERLGLVKPDKYAKLTPNRREFNKLQKEWYGKLAKAEESKPEAQRWHDIEWSGGQNSAFLKRPTQRARVYVPGVGLYNALCTNYLTHNRSWMRAPEYERDIWVLHCQGLSMRNVVRGLNAKHGLTRSVFWIFHRIKRIEAKCMQWNATHPEGLWYGQSTDEGMLTDYDLHVGDAGHSAFGDD